MQADTKPAAPKMIKLPREEAARIAAAYGVIVPEAVPVRKFPQGHSTYRVLDWQELSAVAARIRARQRRFLAADGCIVEGMNERIAQMREEGFTLREIGEKLGMTPSAVYKRSVRARRGRL
jgi:DNA-directed RNA polymerase specialized sigma24 family protein